MVCFKQLQTTIIYLHSISYLVSIQEKYQVTLSGCSLVYQTHFLFALPNIINHACKPPTHHRDHCAKKQSMIDEDESLHACCKQLQSLGGNIAVDQTREHLNLALKLILEILKCMSFPKNKIHSLKYIHLDKIKFAK